MSILSRISHSKRFVESTDIVEKLANIKKLIEALIALEIDHSLKRKMLVAAIWQASEVQGNFHGRYRSQTVIQTAGQKIQRDHIYKKENLVKQLLEASPNIDDVLKKSICCIVTKEEHELLHEIDPAVDGWDRYRKANITVYDMANEKRIV